MQSDAGETMDMFLVNNEQTYMSNCVRGAAGRADH